MNHSVPTLGEHVCHPATCNSSIPFWVGQYHLAVMWSDIIFPISIRGAWVTVSNDPKNIIKSAATLWTQYTLGAHTVLYKIVTTGVFHKRNTNQKRDEEINQKPSLCGSGAVA